MRSNRAAAAFAYGVAAVLLLALGWRALPDGVEAFRYRQPVLLTIDGGVALILIASTVALARALRASAEAGMNRFGVAVLLVTSSCAAASGIQPGAVVASLPALAAVVVALGFGAALLVRALGNRNLSGVAFWSVLYFAAAAAAWQTGLAPAIVTVIVR